MIDLKQDLTIILSYLHAKCVTDSSTVNCDDGKARFVSEAAVNGYTADIRRALNDIAYRRYLVHLATKESKE